MDKRLTNQVRFGGRVARGLVCVACVAALAGCAITPRPLTQDEVRSRVQADMAGMYLEQAPIKGPITMEEAVARALKYSLDYRLKKMESALALGLTEYASKDMLPQLVAKAGYRERSNASGGTSIGILDGVESTRPTSSEEGSRTTGGIEFSWNVLDFGVSYYRARQQSDQFLIAEERRRKVVQNLLQDVRTAYWRALGAQRLSASANEVLGRAAQALAKSQEAETQKIISPGLALNYQRALLDATTLLNQRRQDLEFSRRELAALMNVPAGVGFEVAEVAEVALPQLPKDIARLEDMALLQRPELREEDLRKRVSGDEARKQMLGMLPGLSLNLGQNNDSNRFLYNNNWSEGGLSVAWNLMRLVALPAMKNAQEQQTRTDEARRMALSMAIITQTRIGVERYRMAMEDLRLADQAAQVDARLAAFTRASVTSRLDSELEAIRTQARAVLGAYQRAGAYANAHIAFGRLYNSVGLDAMADNFDGNDLATLTRRVGEHLQASQKDAFVMSSNLFGSGPGVVVRVVGVQDPVQNARMTQMARELLGRHQLVSDEADATALELAFQSAQENGLERVVWTITVGDGQDQTGQHGRFATTVPSNARASMYEASLIAALNANLATIKSRVVNSK